MRNILIVDNEVEMRGVLYDLLTCEGYEVSTAASGEEALCLVQKQRPDLIILDIKMPGMDGIQTLKGIRSFNTKVDVVMLTRVDSDNLEKLANEVGALYFLYKDSEAGLFIKTIAKVLEKKAIGQEAKSELTETILVVDDEPGVCSLLSKFLTDKGFQVKVASSGQEAISLVKKEKPQLVLLDIRMPGMDGILTLKRIKEADRKIGVIMITAVEDMKLTQQAIDLGAFDYVMKPLDLEYLATTVLSKIALSKIVKVV